MSVHAHVGPPTVVCPFSFTPGAAFYGEDARVAWVSPAVERRETLMSTLAQQLDIPSCYLDSWDALEAGLCDLSWVGEERVVLLHSDLARLPMSTLAVYVDVLRDAVLLARDVQLHAVFPLHLRPRIERLLAVG